MLRHLILVTIVVAVVAAPMAVAQEADEEYKPSLESMISEVENLGQLSVGVSSKAITFDWTGIQAGPNMSAWARQAFDRLGDEDGYVSVEEMENGEEILRALVKSELNGLIDDQAASGYFLIDTRNPHEVSITDLTSEGLVGPVDGNQTISLDFRALLTFNTQGKDVHTVKLDMGKYYFRSVDEQKAREVAGDFTLTIAGADGWSIDAESVQPSCAAQAWTGSSIVLDVDDVNCFTGPNEGLLFGFTISGGDDGGLPIPGFEAPLILVGLLGGILLLRRRR